MPPDVVIKSPGVLCMHKGYTGILALRLHEDLQQLAAAYCRGDVRMARSFSKVGQH
jgi:hypothetical protein